MASATVSVLLGPELYDLKIPNIHFPDAIITSIVIPFIHILNDESSKGIISQHGWIQGIRYTLGIYIARIEDLQLIHGKTTKIQKANAEVQLDITPGQTLTASQRLLLHRQCQSLDDNDNSMTKSHTMIYNQRGCLKRHHSLEYDLSKVALEMINNQLVYQSQKPLDGPALSKRVYKKPTNFSLTSVTSSISTIFLDG